jgi:hypothetical protein
MPSAILDLWPPDLFPAPATHPRPPVALLRQQGRALGARTHNFVLCEVETESNAEGTIFTHKLVLVAPFLRYRAPLLVLSHGLQPYPADLLNTHLTGLNQQTWQRQVKDEQELQEGLREFFAQDRVKEVIRIVSNMSNDIALPEYEE